jgi:hypothetical protein
MELYAPGRGEFTIMAAVDAVVIDVCRDKSLGLFFFGFFFGG